MSDSAIICDEVIYAESKDAQQSLKDARLSKKDKNKKNFNEKKATCKTQNFCILLALLLITTALLIGVSIYCYLIKY